MVVRRLGALLVTLFGLGLASAAAVAGRAPPRPASVSPKVSAPRLATTSDVPPASEPPSVFTRLPALEIATAANQRSLSLRLYDARGYVDESAARQLDALLADSRDPDHVRTIELARRTLQLLYRAAYHFRVARVEVVSAYRAPGRRREGPHGSGRAIDFKLPGVKAATLAAYLRKQPRVGVGVYTHRKTQYVHLDVRETSYHWLDASPPGRSWRAQRLRDSSSGARDARYTPGGDWPEGAQPPADAISRSLTPVERSGDNDHG